MKKTVETIQKYDTKKDGTQYVDRSGKPFSRVVVKFVDDANQYSCLVYNKEKQREYFMKPGDEYDVVTEKQGEFYNFKCSTQNDVLLARVEALEKVVAQLVKAHNKDALSVVEYPEDDIPADLEIPF